MALNKVACQQPRGIGTQRKCRLDLRVDWFRVLTDLQYAEWPHSRVAAELGVPLATLRGWKAGSEPAYGSGARLVALWAREMGRDRDTDSQPTGHHRQMI